MKQVVVYGVGSPIIGDLEESLFRSGCSIVVGVKNFAGENFLTEGIPVISPDSVSDEIRGLPFLIPLFSPGNRQSAAIEARNNGFLNPYSLIDPSVAVPRSLEMAPGGYINAGCSLGSHSRLGSFVFINRGVSLGHHARLDNFVSLGPGAVLGGLVSIEMGAMIGTGAIVLPGISIGENSVVGAGAVVTHDVPAYCLVLGNPAKIVKQNIPGYKGSRVSAS